jgi:anaerobic magnesium-protoporphyrin IX monomethyl ester cyclase
MMFSTDSASGGLRAGLSILVAHAYFQRFDQKQFERAKPYPPLATLQVAASLRDAGNRVAVFDAMLANGVEEYDDTLRRVEPQLALFYEDNFNYLSKMCLGKMRKAACEMMAHARRRGVRVIAAGSDVSDAPAVYLAAGADVVLLGEGLAALNALVGRLEIDPRMDVANLVDGIGGIVTASDGKLVVANAARTAGEQQGTPTPAWDLIDVERYRSTWKRAHGYFSLNMAASRGCSFRCSWCAKPIWGNRYLQRDPYAVAQEMQFLKQSYQPDHVWFADDIFGFRVDWVTEFASALHALDGSIPFTIQTRADLISAGMARALRDANCHEAWIGAESGSQRVLDAMNKGTRVEDLPLARERLAAQNIRVGFFIQLGYLDEQLGDLLATRQLIENCRPDDIGVSVSYPLPGTPFYEKVREQLRAKTHWQESNDLDMMFEGTYDSLFYRAIRDLLHDQVTLDNRSSQLKRNDYERDRRALERRWELLIVDETQHRNQVEVAVPG